MPTYYLSDDDLIAAQYELLKETAPATLDEAQGWTVDKKSGKASPYKPDTVQASGTFVDEPTAFTALGYRTQNPLNGNFSAGNFILYFKVKNNAYYAQKGYVKFRLWRSPNADGSAAVEITSGWVSSTQISFPAGNTYVTGSITWTSASPVTLNNEYLFLEIEWYASVSGGNNAAAVYWVHNEGTAERLDTPTWNPSAAANFDQKHFRFFNDDVSLNEATPKAAEDTNISGQQKGQNLRVRIEVANTGSASGNITRRLEWRRTSGTPTSWTAIGATGEVKLADSPYFTDGEATTSRLTPTGTFTAGQGKDAGSDTSQISLAVNYYTEDEWNIVFDASAPDGGVYEFRITNAGAVLDTYSVTPQVTLYQPPTYISYGKPFLFTQGNWGAVNFYFEVYMRAISGTVYARLYDETAGQPVANSELSTNQTTMQRLRSPALSLIDGNTYRAQFGKSGSDSGAFLGAKLLVV